MPRVFGRFAAPDERDRKFAIPRTRKIVLPERKNWPEGQPIYQDDTPRCVGYAWAGMLSDGPVKQFVDPNGIYALAQQNDEWEGEDYDGTSVRAGAKVLALLGFLREYQWAFRIQQIVEAVLTKGPVVVGTNWYSRMDEPDNRGLVVVDGEVLGGHAWRLTGYDQRTKLFRARNNWRGWGLAGKTFASRFYVHRDDMERLLAEEGEACLGVDGRPQAALR